jgi:hypothetical protein
MVSKQTSPETDKLTLAPAVSCEIAAAVSAADKVKI